MRWIITLANFFDISSPLIMLKIFACVLIFSSMTWTRVGGDNFFHDFDEGRYCSLPHITKIRHPLHNLGEEIILPSVWSFSGFLFHFLENSWCREQSFKTVIEKYLVESDYFDTGMGRALLQTAGLSVLTPLWMFLVGKYNLDRR